MRDFGRKKCSFYLIRTRIGKIYEYPITITHSNPQEFPRIKKFYYTQCYVCNVVFKPKNTPEV